MPDRPAARLAVLAAVLLFVAVDGYNALHKGGDAQVFFEGGRRLLEATPLYENSGPASGFIGPPFQAAFFVPFAVVQRHSDRAARLLWYAVNLVSLCAGVWFWSSAWIAGLAQSDLAAVHRRWSPWLALAAIALPLQTNFEHQNMNALLLAATGAAAWSLVKGRCTLAGALIGFAAALKVFPALLLVYLPVRRRWRAFATGTFTFVALTILPLLLSGPSQFLEDADAWLRIGGGGWPTRGSNQSLIAAIDRIVAGTEEPGIHSVADSPASAIVFAVAAAALATCAIWMLRRRPSDRSARAASELAVVVTLSVLLSPVAWDHYWVLLFPAFLLIADSASPRLLGRAGAAVFWTAAILTSGISRATVGAAVWGAARRTSSSTLAAFILYCALLALWQRLPATSTRTVTE